MSGIVAVLGDGKSQYDLRVLASRMRFRGPYLYSPVRGKRYSVGVLRGIPETASKNGLPAALDGYVVFPGDKEILTGSRGEARLSSLWEKDGPSMFENIEGEFALALGADDGGCLMARDPHGVKPLYYTIKDDSLYFASEIKALISVGGSVKEAPPGSYYQKETGWVSYYEQAETAGTSNEIDLSGAKSGLRRLLRRSIEEKMACEERLGVYLSGGLDSSIIASLAADISPGPVSTFTVGVKGSRDIRYARKVADRIGSRHHEYTYDLDEMLAVLPEVIYHLESFDCAYVRSAIPNYIAARLAVQEGRSTMLTGEGADELFAGYTYLRELDCDEQINREITGFINNLSNTGLQRVDRMNSAHGIDCRVPFLKPALVKLVMGLPLEWKLRQVGDKLLDKWILRRSFEQELGGEVAWREKQQFDQGSGSAGLLEQVAEQQISDAEYSEEAAKAPVPVRNKEELYYYRIFRHFFPESVLHLVGRWIKTG